MALIGVGLVAALVLKLEASRPRYKKQIGAYSVPESAAPGAPFRRADKLGELTTMAFPGCDTIFSTFQYAARVNGRRNAVGTRAVLKVRCALAARACGSGPCSAVRSRRGGGVEAREAALREEMIGPQRSPASHAPGAASGGRRSRIRSAVTTCTPGAVSRWQLSAIGLSTACVHVLTLPRRRRP